MRTIEVRVHVHAAAAAFIIACGGDPTRGDAAGGLTLASGSSSSDGSTAEEPAGDGTTLNGSPPGADETTTSMAPDGPTGGSTADTGDESGSTGGGTSADGATEPTTTDDGGPGTPESCDGLDNDDDGLFDEGCDCSSDPGLNALEGFSARVVFDQATDLVGFGRLGDVERALGDYWELPGEGVLFTINSADDASAGIAAMTQEGQFVGWIVHPDDKLLPHSAYLEYAYDDTLWVCTTAGGDKIYKVHAGGEVEELNHHGNCEGLAYGDLGDGARLYASNWSTGIISVLTAEGYVMKIAGGLPVVVDLAFPRPGSQFMPGLYAINQTTGGVHRFVVAGDELEATLPFAYGPQFGVGEEFSFADPGSPFGDFFYHLSASKNEVQRIAPNGSTEVVVSGPTLQLGGFYSTGAVFSTSGGYYYFTNEDQRILRLQACSPVPG